ncbi:MAG: glucokinase [Actinomycetota bacterium]
MNHVGIDVGGTKCHGVRIDSDGTLLAELRYPTPHADDLISLLESMFRELGGETTLGIGVPGLISHDGIIHASPNLVGARDVPVGPELRRQTGIAVHVENDATSAAFAEWRVGAAAGTRDAIMVTLGTGIGGGIVMGGELHRGAHGFAGEIGHMVVERNGVPCPCGLHGCWERYASGSALRYLSGGLSGEEVFRKFYEGDSAAQSVVNEFAQWIAVGLASLTNICDPEVIVLGGGVVESFNGDLSVIEKYLSQSLYSSAARPHPRLCSATLGERAGAIGAALLVAENL